MPHDKGTMEAYAKSGIATRLIAVSVCITQVLTIRSKAAVREAAVAFGSLAARKEPTLLR
jgi:hypothetical protein